MVPFTSLRVHGVGVSDQSTAAVYYWRASAHPAWRRSPTWRFPCQSPFRAPPATPRQTKRLTDRVIARLKDAHRAVSASSRPGLGKARRRRVNDTDTRALRRVFLDLGDSYRSYRQRTGEPVSPEVKEAALRFRRELDLPSLVWVAASLERLDHDMVG